jgi:hypothetical protein
MNTKLLMASGALFLAALGLAGTFLPQEIAVRAGADAHGLIPLLIQLLGALYLGFAMLDWMAKESVIGGIYARPLSVGNLVHFTVGALALGKGVLAGQRATSVLVLAALYALFAIAFATVVFGSPKRAT